MDSHQREIVLKEKYGSSAKERYYVKPSEQLNVVLFKDEKFVNVADIFTKIFLPQGYPDSVSKDYIAYQMWDTAQAFCSTITGTLATQEVLRGVGVGDTTATPLAATITWVLKDGCGHLGKILFAYSHGSYLDSYSKKWRLFADILNDAAMCIEIALPQFGNYITIALCVSTVMKSIVGIAGGATKAAITQHHALRGNMADVSAKDSAQETAVNLIASFTALLIISCFGSDGSELWLFELRYGYWMTDIIESAYYIQSDTRKINQNSLFIFFIMLTLHIVFNYFAVRAVCLRTLNEPRFLQVIDTYLKRDVIANPCEINYREPIVFYQLGSNSLDLKLCGFQIKIGHSVTQLTKNIPKASDLQRLKEIYVNKKYMLFPDTNNKVMYVFVKEHATVDDILCAYFQAFLLAIITCSFNDHRLPIIMATSSHKSFAQIYKMLELAKWSHVIDNGSGFKYEASYKLLRYICFIATREWQALRAGLIHTGWDLNKHLLIMDEWRLCDDDITTETISPDDMKDFRPAGPLSMKESLNEKELDDLFEKDSCVIEPEESPIKQNTRRPTRMMPIESEAVEKKRVVKE